MVQGINWNSYTPAQIIEMRQQGIQVPDDVYNDAETALSEQDKGEITSSGEDSATYTIDNTSNQVNEAKELRAQLEAEGASLKQMVKQFTAKANEATTQLTDTYNDISKYSDLIISTQEDNEGYIIEANEEIDLLNDLANDANEEIAKLQKIIEDANKVLESDTATEAEKEEAQTQITDAQGKINTILSNNDNDITDKQNNADRLVSNANTSGSLLEDLAGLLNNTYDEAQNGIELANETKELSQKLYKQGKKASKIGAALGSVIGGVGGFFGGKAITNAISNNAVNKYVNAHQGQDGSYINKNGYSTTKEGIMAEAQDQTGAQTKNIAGSLGGVISGTAMGAGLGSLIGSQKKKLGQAGISAAGNLTSMSNSVMNETQKMASNNNIAINVVNNSTEVVNELKDVADNTTIETPETPQVQVETTPTEDSANPKKAKKA